MMPSFEKYLRTKDVPARSRLLFLITKNALHHLHEAVIVSQKWKTTASCPETIRIRIYGLALGVVVVVFALGTRADDDDDRHHGCGTRSSHD